MCWSGKSDGEVRFGGDEEQTLSKLRNAEINRFENPRVDAIPNSLEARVDFVTISAPVVCQQPLDVFHDDPGWPDLFDDPDELYKEIISGIVLIALAVGAVALAARPPNDKIYLSSSCPPDMLALDLANVFNKKGVSGFWRR